MKRYSILLISLAMLLMASAASAQQLDFAFGVGTLTSPSASSASGSYSPQKLGGGGFPSFSGDILFKHQLGVQAEVAWRGHPNIGYGFQPYRPILYDFNAIYAPRFGSRAGAEIMAGFGGESVRFYTPYVNCSFTGCTDYVSSNHLLVHVGGGLKFYVTHSIFVRPEVHAYYIRNNYEFSSPRVFREGVSIGYTFRPED
ncbi:MAG TPA: outer membrane beta-barrel protein [Terriglobales bacterium]